MTDPDPDAAAAEVMKQVHIVLAESIKHQLATMGYPEDPSAFNMMSPTQRDGFKLWVEAERDRILSEVYEGLQVA